MEIDSEEQLQDLSNGKHCLVEDIYLTDSFETILKFKGTLDGQGYTIYNLKNTFIDKILKNTTVQNINFSNGDLKNSGGIFKINNGSLVNITADDFNCEFNWSNSGCIVKKNKGDIQNCHVIDSNIGGDHCGSIAAYSKSGDIIDCTVQNVDITGVEKSGGICAYVGKGNVSGCSCENTTITSSSVSGGIVGYGEKLELQNNSVIDCDIRSDSFVGGIVGSNSVNSIKECSVLDSDFYSSKGFNGIGSVSESGSVKNCSVENCTIVMCRKDSYVSPICRFGNVEKCYAEGLTVKGHSINMFTNTNTIKYSYFNFDKILHSGDLQLGKINWESSYYSLNEAELPEKNTVEVYDHEDLYKIRQNDIVQLKQDIDANGTGPLCRLFTGSFDGNGNCIENLKGNLFKFVQGEIKNLTIKNPTIGRYKSGIFVAQKIHDSEIVNVEVQKDESIDKVNRAYPLSETITNSLVKNCSINIDITTSRHTSSGFCGEVKNSKVRNCESTIDITVEGDCSGLVKSLGNNSLIESCSSSGNINFQKSDGLPVTIGGIVSKNWGGIIKNTKSDIKIQGSVNSDQKIGGIVSIGNGEVRNCEFNGNIKINLEESTEDELFENNVFGGIVAEGSSEIRDCVNNGDIITRGISGGIVGLLNIGKVENCDNYGIIHSPRTSGGIIGKFKSGTVHKCANNGRIKGGEIGGLIGKLTETSTGKLHNCYTDNIVQTESDILIGTNKSDTVNIKDLYWISDSENLEHTSSYGTGKNISEKQIRILLRV